jgi:tetratricopeptide (TPR) repeat protein
VKKQPKRGFGSSTGNQQGSRAAKHQKPPAQGDKTTSNLESLIRQGKLHEAESLCNKLITENPNNDVLQSTLGSLLRDQGDLDRAKSAYKKAIEINPNSTEDLCNLGDLSRQLADPKTAATFYSQATRIDQYCLRGYYNLGLINKEIGNYDDAIASFKLVAKLKPDLAEAYISIGAILQEQGQHSAAINSLKTALHYQPHSAQALNNLGLALGSIGDHKAAVQALLNAVKINPDFAEAHNNLGLALQRTDQLTDAINSFNNALKLRKDFAKAHNNLGLALQDRGEILNAMASFKNALRLNPNLYEVRCNLSMLELLSGDYEQGLKNYEFRFTIKAGRDILLAKPGLPRWDEKSFKAGQKLLLVSEQGLGDTLHFMRYVQTLKEVGVDVSLCAQSKLHELIKASGVDSSPLTPEEALDNQHGHWLPLLSLPQHLGITPDNPIANNPYIKIPDSLIKSWKARLSSEHRPIIGINWQGNPDHEQSSSSGRSLPLEAFAPIANIEDITLLSLQKGFGSEQLDQCSFKNRFVQCQDQINETWNFLETAAIIANCDLVITSDTSVAHLAGGMGQATWILLKQIPEWRWGIHGETTFWYPSARLFRQTEQGNWHAVTERVATALKKSIEVSMPQETTRANPH